MRKAPITLLKSGNSMVVDSLDPSVIRALRDRLAYTSRRFLYGAERAIRGVPMELQVHECYGLDHRGRLGTSWGFHHRVRTILEKAGHEVSVTDLDPPADPLVFEPQWERVLERPGVEFRHGQLECLVKMLANPCGCIDCPPAFGKTFIIGILAMLLPRAVIHVVTRRVAVLRDRIYPDLQSLLPSVGICCGGRKILGRRVQLFSADSLGHSDGRADIMIGDESHELASNRAAGLLARYDRSRNYGLSATHNMRLDNKDMCAEAIFGPIIFRMGYEEARQHDLVSPIEVRWSDCVMDYDPCGGINDPVERKRRGIWRNDVRNSLIAADARSYPPETQKLITCETIEHALAIKRQLPEFELVYRPDGISQRDRSYYRNQGLWPRDFEGLTLEKLAGMTRAFERGDLKGVIATTVWNVGVSFNHLAVLLRGDAGGSPIMDTQIPGRTSRLSDSKTTGIIRDYLDQFDRGFCMKARGRMRNYQTNGWKQVLPEKKLKTRRFW